MKYVQIVEQNKKELDLTETDGSYICSKCGEEVKVNLEERNKQTNKKATE